MLIVVTSPIAIGCTLGQDDDIMNQWLEYGANDSFEIFIHIFFFKSSISLGKYLQGIEIGLKF